MRAQRAMIYEGEYAAYNGRVVPGVSLALIVVDIEGLCVKGLNYA